VRTIVLVFENTAVGPAGLALGRSSIRRRILELLMAEPDVRLHLREIQRRSGTSPGTASRELGRLVAAGIVDRRVEGHQVYFSAADSPYTSAFRTILAAPVGRVESAPGDPADGPPRQEAPLPARESVDPARDPRTIRSAPTARTRKPDQLGLKVAGRLAEVLRPLYAGRLIGVFMYGARAGGEGRSDADVEVVVVLDAIDSYGVELERTSATCAALSLEYDVIVSRLFVTEGTWRSRTDGHLPALRLEAIAL
jgi:DNA-binding transcriptional ArsR family regulator